MFNKYFMVLCLCGLSYAQNSPVFLWGSSSTPFKPALRSLSAGDFAEIISSNLKDSILLVFLEPNLHTQDFSQCKLESGETCFANLKTFKTKTFYADVEDPVKSVKSLAKEDSIENIKIGRDGKLPKNIKYEAGKIVLVSFDEKIEERSKALIEHDSIMAELYKMMLDQGKVLAVYTSQENSQSIHRLRRQAKDDTGTILTGKDGDISILAYIKKVILDKDAVEVKTMKLMKENSASDNVEVTLDTSKGDIKFIVAKAYGYWHIKEMTLGGSEKFSTDIESAVGFSYYCGSLVFTSDQGKILTFNNLQIQPFYKNRKGDKFDDPWHCVGFISGGIISGLFVTLMFLIIMSIGITWLMDIRTMDRFDDPKGKTITINVTD